MNPSHHQSNALFAVPASLSSFLIAAALTCGFAPGQDTQFQGLTHRSVGNAQLSINPTGHLVVSVGSPGPAADGVEVLLPSGVGPVLEHEVFMVSHRSHGFASNRSVAHAHLAGNREWCAKPDCEHVRSREASRWSRLHRGLLLHRSDQSADRPLRKRTTGAQRQRSSERKRGRVGEGLARLLPQRVSAGQLESHVRLERHDCRARTSGGLGRQDDDHG